MAGASCFGFLFLLVLLLASSTRARLIDRDAAALASFKNAFVRLPWNVSLDPCTQWRGISCIPLAGNNNDSQRVLKIILPGEGLAGRLPEGVLEPMDALAVLSLRKNRLSGPLPADIAKLANLRSLTLQANEFSGSIPWDFTSLPNLARIDLSFNRLNGSIPSSIGKLRPKIVLLQNNSFSGSIPSLGATPDVFSVANNRLQGSIPESLSSLPVDGFQGNEGLCGAPLEACEVVSSPAPIAKPSETNDGKSRSKLSLGFILSIIIGDIAVLAVITTLFMLCYWHKHTKWLSRKNGASDKSSSSNEFKSSEDYMSSGQGDPQAGTLSFLKPGRSNFSLEDLLRASAEMIGQGSLGTSYRAVVDDGQIVTVKRIKGVELGRKEFEQKMVVLGSLSHENVLSPKAYYFSKSEKLVVMDFAPRGSLALHLHEAAAPALDWTSRLRIALGAARGLAFLHSSSPHFVHGNLKSSNILIMRGFEAKVADHGLIQLLPPEASIAASLACYRAPELAATRRFTQQTDVYAYGVLLLEMLTGRAPWRTNSRGERMDLPAWVQSVVREEWTGEVFDQGILRFSEEEMLQVLQIGLACVNIVPGDRPSMTQVVQMIETVRENWGPDEGSYSSDAAASGGSPSYEKDQISLDSRLPHVKGPLPARTTTP